MSEKTDAKTIFEVAERWGMSPDDIYSLFASKSLRPAVRLTRAASIRRDENAEDDCASPPESFIISGLFYFELRPIFSSFFLSSVYPSKYGRVLGSDTNPWGQDMDMELSLSGSPFPQPAETLVTEEEMHRFEYENHISVDESVAAESGSRSKYPPSVVKLIGCLSYMLVDSLTDHSAQSPEAEAYRTKMKELGPELIKSDGCICPSTLYKLVDELVQSKHLGITDRSMSQSTQHPLLSDGLEAIGYLN